MVVVRPLPLGLDSCASSTGTLGRSPDRMSPRFGWNSYPHRCSYNCAVFFFPSARRTSSCSPHSPKRISHAAWAGSAYPFSVVGYSSPTGIMNYDYEYPESVFGRSKGYPDDFFEIILDAFSTAAWMCTSQASLGTQDAHLFSVCCRASHIMQEL